MNDLYDLETINFLPTLSGSTMENMTSGEVLHKTLYEAAAPEWATKLAESINEYIRDLEINRLFIAHSCVDIQKELESMNHLLTTCLRLDTKETIPGVVACGSKKDQIYVIIKDGENYNVLKSIERQVVSYKKSNNLPIFLEEELGFLKLPVYTLESILITNNVLEIEEVITMRLLEWLK